MGVSFTTEGRDHEGDPRQARVDENTNLDCAIAAGGFERDPDSGSPVVSRSVLIQVIEGEIIPRLFLAHRHRPQQRIHSGPPEVWKEPAGGGDVFAGLFLAGNIADIVNRLQDLMDHGVPRERVYVEVLAPVARTLGIFWEEGRCSFDDMAKGLACIDEVVQEMSTRSRASPADSH